MVSLIALLAAAVSVVSASTPPGFQPAVGAELVVDFGSTLINGQVVAKNRELPVLRGWLKDGKDD